MDGKGKRAARNEAPRPTRRTDATTGDRTEAHDLRGGCAFSPAGVDRRLVSLRGLSRREARMAVGAGEIEFPSRPNETAPARQSIRTWRFSPEELRTICREIREAATPPAPKGAARLVLLPVSPRVVHAYWIAPPEAVEAARSRCGKPADHAPPVLRFYEIAYVGARRALREFDVELDTAAADHRAELDAPGRRFVAELGLRLPDGRFEPIARSQAVELAPEDPAPDVARDRIFVAAHARPAPRPTAPAHAAPARKPSDIEFLDEPGRDLHAEQHVRDVYRRVLLEGPRVLTGRPGIRPTPRETLLEEYREREAEREAARRRAASSPAPLAPRAAQPAADVDGVQDAPSGTAADAARDSARESREEDMKTPLRQAAPDREALLPIHAEAANADARSLAVAGRLRDLAEACADASGRERLLAVASAATSAAQQQGMIAFAGGGGAPLLAASVETGAHLAPPAPGAIGHASSLSETPAASPDGGGFPHASAVPASAQPPAGATPPASAANADDPFLAGLDIKPRPAPSRPRPDVPKRSKAKRQTPKPTGWRPPSPEEFLAGLDLPAPAAKGEAIAPESSSGPNAPSADEAASAPAPRSSHPKDLPAVQPTDGLVFATSDDPTAAFGRRHAPAAPAEARRFDEELQTEATVQAPACASEEASEDACPQPDAPEAAPSNAVADARDGDLPPSPLATTTEETPPADRPVASWTGADTPDAEAVMAADTHPGDALAAAWSPPAPEAAPVHLDADDPALAMALQPPYEENAGQARDEAPTPAPSPSPARQPTARTAAPPEAAPDPAAPQSDTPRPDELELEATVTLAGRAPANSTVRLAGRALPVAEDGRFHLEIGILDGQLDIPVEVEKKDDPQTERRVDVSLELKRTTRHDVWSRVRILPPKRKG